MARYLCSRILHLLLILLLVSFLSYALMIFAGADPISIAMERHGVALNASQLAQARHELGIDQPFLIQYGHWLTNILHGNMGVSFVSGQEVLPLFLSKLPATLALMALSIFLTLAISLPAGVAAAAKRGRIADIFIRIFSFIGNSLPNFLIAVLLISLFCLTWGILPVISSGNTLRGAILPALTLAIAMSAKYIRHVRTLVLEHLCLPHIRAGRARGLKEKYLLYAYALRESTPALIVLIALSIGSLMGGSAIVESIFMWDGVGKLAVEAIHSRDYPVIQAYVVWMASIFVCVNAGADIAASLLDPRIRANATSSFLPKEKGDVV